MLITNLSGVVFKEYEAKFNSALKRGEEVYMKSGVIGTISGMTDKIVTLEVSEGTKMKFLRFIKKVYFVRV